MGGRNPGSEMRDLGLAAGRIVFATALASAVGRLGTRVLSRFRGTQPCVLSRDETNQAASPEEHHRLDFPRPDHTYWGQYREYSATSLDGKSILATVTIGRACLIAVSTMQP